MSEPFFSVWLVFPRIRFEDKAMSVRASVTACGIKLIVDASLIIKHVLPIWWMAASNTDK